MAYSICYIKNVSGETATLNGKEFTNNEVYQITDIDRIDWATEDAVLVAVSGESFEIHNSFGAIEGISNQIDWLKDY